MQEYHSDYSRVAQLALVLGSCDHVMSGSFVLTQPFNQTRHRNLHAWLLESQQSRSRASLGQWQCKFRLLENDQPDQFMRPSAPFYEVVPQ